MAMALHLSKVRTKMEVPGHGEIGDDSCDTIL